MSESRYLLRDALFFEHLWLTGDRFTEVARLNVGSVMVGAFAVRISLPDGCSRSPPATSG